MDLKCEWSVFSFKLTILFRGFSSTPPSVGSIFFREKRYLLHQSHPPRHSLHTARLHSRKPETFTQLSQQLMLHTNQQRKKQNHHNNNNKAQKELLRDLHRRERSDIPEDFPFYLLFPRLIWQKKKTLTPREIFSFSKKIRLSKSVRRFH